MPFLEDSDELDQLITSLSVEIFTVDAPKAGTDDKVYCNVLFTDGSLLVNPLNHRIHIEGHQDFEPGITDTYSLPIPDGLDKKIGDIDDFYIRKEKTIKGGWLLGSALLFANGLGTPVMGNRQINEFLDNEAHLLFRGDWSPRSLCGSSPLPAEYPLLCPQYRIAGPALGQLSDTSARILYRVDQEGTYKLKVFQVLQSQLVFEDAAPLSPTHTFEVPNLLPNTRYRFSFFRVFGEEELPIPEGDGEFETFPPDGTGVRFSFGFGSCARNRDNVSQNAWTGIKNLAPDPSSDPYREPEPPNNLRFFLHLGDTFYFYDDVTEKEPKNLRTVLAANLSARRHPRFLDMAQVVPSCAVWDDHDFRKDNSDSVGFSAKGHALNGFLDYWGNRPINKQEFGLTTRNTYGNVDIYLMDGRFLRDRGADTCFTKEQLDQILATIDERGRRTNRLVILASGSTWNHTNAEGEGQAYGNSDYDEERESFYNQLNSRIGGTIKGLAFLSGDVHINEIYEIVFEVVGAPSKVAPELVSSPLGYNSSLKGARPITGERKWSVPSEGDDAKRGFATLEIDTTASEPDGGWTIKVSYYDANASVTSPYHTKEYTLTGGQFVF